MNPTTQLMTADELFKLPTGMGKVYELIKGELRTMTPPGFEHGAVGMNLGSALAQFVRANKLGIVTLETGFILARNPDTVRAPDIAFVRADRIERTGITEKFWPGPPDLAVEVVSPGDTIDEIEDKVQHWLDAGTQLVWVVSSKRKSVTVYTPNGGAVILSSRDTLDGGDLAPGFKIQVADIFVQ